MCWEGAVGLDFGANTSTYCRFISIYTSRAQSRAGPSVGRPGWPMGPWMLPQQRTNCQTCPDVRLAYLFPAYAEGREGGGEGLDVQETATCEILDATLPHSRSLGSDHALCDALLLLFVSRACCRHQLTCALITPGGRSRARRRPFVSRRGDIAARTTKTTWRQDINTATYLSLRAVMTLAPRADGLPHVLDADRWGRPVSPRPPL